MDQANIAVRAGGLAAAWFAKLWHATLDIQIVAANPAFDCTSPFFEQPCIYLLWHEYMLLPLGIYGHANCSMLVSKHRDAHLLCRVGQHMGIDVVRGSTTRGGLSALRELKRRAGLQNIVITPDGPQGPRRKMAPGAIYLASRLQMPIICVGIGYDRPKRMGTWDRFALPRPFSRCRLISADPIRPPQDARREEIEAYRVQTEQTLIGLTNQAEEWAASNSRLPHQRPARFWAPGQYQRHHNSQLQAAELSGDSSSATLAVHPSPDDASPTAAVDHRAA